MQTPSLKKNVTALEAIAIVVGMIIGSGIFLKPGIVLAHAGSPMMSLLAWIAGGVITLASALSVAEIASSLPRAGGLYTYLSELYGDVWGFLLGWVQAVVSYPASIAAQTIAFTTYASFFIPMLPWQQKLMALSALAFLLLMNVLSTKYGGVIQVLATIGKLVPIVAIVSVGFLSQSAPGAAGMTGLGAAGTGFGAAILGTLWAYDGWISVTNMAGELKKPSKTLPLVISGGVIFVIVVYAVFNMVIFRTLPYDVIVASETPGAAAAEALFGSAGAAFITAGIMVSVFGALNGYLMTAARVPQAMGAERRFPMAAVLARVHPRFNTPANALIFQSLLAVVYIFSGTFNTLTDLLVFVLWIFFVMGVFSVFLLRRRGLNVPGTYRVPFYPITPLIGVVGGVYILISTVMTSPARSFVGIGITLLGLPVYWWLNRKNARAQ